MSQLFTCPKGHQWQITTAGANPAAFRRSTCPVCGAGGESLTDFGRPGDLTTGADTPTEPRPELMRGIYPNVPGYEILSELGRGGMGVVYLAKQRNLNRRVALKMVLSGTHAGATELTRFRREAEAVARLQHPNFVHIYDIGEHDGLPYFSLEFVDGGNLAQKLAAGPVAFRDAAELTETLARAMHRAHQQDIVHRDLKPANVLLTQDGVPKIADFGLAKKLDDAAGPTVTGAVLGTPSYMAPEQARGIKQVGPAADVYSLGVILYEMLTGRPPFRGESTFDTMFKVVWEVPDPPSNQRPDVPSALEAICLHCLAKEPDQRFPNAEALADALRDYLGGGVEFAEPSADAPSPRSRTTVLVLAGLMVVLGGGLIGTALWYLQNQSAGPPPTPTGGAPTPGDVRPRADAWELLPPLPIREPVVSFAFPTREVGFVASATELFRTTDGGRTWKNALEKPPADGPIQFVHFTNAKTGRYGNQKLHITSDGGEMWTNSTPHSAAFLRITAFSVARPGFVLGGGTVRDSTGFREGDLVLFRKGTNEVGRPELIPGDAEKSYWGPGKRFRQWTAVATVTLGVTHAALLLQGPDDETVLLRTYDRGSTWSPALGSDEKTIAFLAAGSQTRGWAASAAALWREEGKVWTRLAFKPPAEVRGLACSRSGSLVAVALANGKVLLTTDGTDWQTTDPKLGALKLLAVADDGCVLVVDAENRCARYIRAGIAAGPAEE